MKRTCFFSCTHLGSNETGFSPLIFKRMILTLNNFITVQISRRNLISMSLRIPNPLTHMLSILTNVELTGQSLSLIQAILV